jgi:hypothetical protein
VIIKTIFKKYGKRLKKNGRKDIMTEKDFAVARCMMKFHKQS